MTVDDFVQRVRAARAAAAGTDEGERGAGFIVYVLGSKELFAGEVLEVSSDGVLLRQGDGTEALILRRHIVAISAAEP